MKRILILILVGSLFTLKGFSQIYDPVNWSYAAKKTGKNEAVIFVKATLADGWHLYSQFIQKGGPQPTKFTFEKSPTYTLTGTLVESTPITRLEPLFMMEVSYFEKSAIFRQKVKLKGKKAKVKGKVMFGVCNDKMCLPPNEVEFTVEVI